MATRNFVEDNDPTIAIGTRRIRWSGLLQGDDGNVIQAGNLSDKTVQFWGTFGTATAVFQGTNDTTAATSPSTAAWETVSDPQGNPVSKLTATTPKGEAITENYEFYRPLITGGDGTTNIICGLNAKG